jgi:hypothetical protein
LNSMTALYESPITAMMKFMKIINKKKVPIPHNKNVETKIM